MTALDGWRPYGHALLAFFEGDRDAALVIHDDFGDRDTVPASYFFREPGEFPSIEREALDRCRGRVLDVGAGAGCHSIALQARGHDVTAIEVRPELEQLLLTRGVPDVRITPVLDLTGERFDTVLMLMNGLGIAGTLEGLTRLLEHLHDLVEPGGQVLADSVDLRGAYASTVGVSDLRVRDDGRYLGELTLQLEYLDERGAPFPHLYVDPDVLHARAAATGWTCEVVLLGQSGEYLARLVTLGD